ncbi:hypothetical protein [Pseudacidovorax intermedius]|uniref:hypothetical protein n=1 Tax=Pseudacidovorax intermedius TaxID=433924 RepID=UPI0026EFFFE3|nr:hypothetical protein [Pseudacidovorax intermedius]
MDDITDAQLLRKLDFATLASGLLQLPTAHRDQPSEISALVCCPSVGAVRITYRLSLTSHRGAPMWFWYASRARLEQGMQRAP